MLFELSPEQEKLIPHSQCSKSWTILELILTHCSDVFAFEELCIICDRPRQILNFAKELDFLQKTQVYCRTYFLILNKKLKFK